MRRGRAGLLLAVLAFVLRLAVPAMPMPMPMPLSAGGSGILAGDFAQLPICHAGGPDAPSDRQPLPAPAHDCALCPACQLAAAPAVLPAPGWAMPPPAIQAARAAPLPPATGPPRHGRYAARPRGPPTSAV